MVSCSVSKSRWWPWPIVMAKVLSQKSQNSNECYRWNQRSRERERAGIFGSFIRKHRNTIKVIKRKTLLASFPRIFISPCNDFIPASESLGFRFWFCYWRHFRSHPVVGCLTKQRQETGKAGKASPTTTHQPKKAKSTNTRNYKTTF